MGKIGTAPNISADLSRLLKQRYRFRENPGEG
jgi:hypothetical protein